MKKKYLSIFILVLSFSYLQGQYIDPLKRKQQDSTQTNVGEKKKKKREKKKGTQRWFKGGNFSMQFSPLSVDVSPSLFYRISPKLQVGGGVSYVYTRIEQGDSVEHLSIYGGRLQIQPRLSQYLFLQVEYETLNVKKQENADTGSKRIWLHNPQLGAGIAYPLGKSLSLNLSVLYNFNYDEKNSPFPSPWRFRFGFSF